MLMNVKTGEKFYAMDWIMDYAEKNYGKHYFTLTYFERNACDKAFLREMKGKAIVTVKDEK